MIVEESILDRQQISRAVEDSLRECLESVPARVDENDDLAALGVDSLKAVELLVLVEDHAGIRLPAGCEVELAEADTVGALVSAIESILVKDSRSHS